MSLGGLVIAIGIIVDGAIVVTENIARHMQDKARAICRTYRHSPHTVGKALDNSQPRSYTRTKPVAAPVLRPFMHIIDQILLDDQSQPVKQRHKASKIYRRLIDEYGYKGGYDQVRRYVKKQRRREHETFIPLGGIVRTQLENVKAPTDVTLLRL